MENPIFLPRFTLSKPSCSSGAAGVSSFRPVFQLLGDCSQLSWISARHPVFTFQTFSSSSLCQIPKPVSSPDKDPSLEKSLVIETPVITLLAVPNSHVTVEKQDLPGPAATMGSKKRDSTWENKGSYPNSTCETRYAGPAHRRPRVWEECFSYMKAIQENSLRTTQRVASGVCVSTSGSWKSQKTFLGKHPCPFRKCQKCVCQTWGRLKRLPCKGEPRTV